MKAGHNGSEHQRCKCKERGIYYTIKPKQHAYPEETRALAIKMYCDGVSGRRVGKILGTNKSNVMHWIKGDSQTRKNEKISTSGAEIAEPDELYWFVEYQPRTEPRENI